VDASAVSSLLGAGLALGAGHRGNGRLCLSRHQLRQDAGVRVRGDLAGAVASRSWTSLMSFETSADPLRTAACRSARRPGLTRFRPACRTTACGPLLGAPPCLKHLYRRRAHGEPADAVDLRGLSVQHVGDLDDLRGDAEPAVRQVHLRSGRGAHRAASRSDRDEGVPEGVEVIVAHPVQESTRSPVVQTIIGLGFSSDCLHCSTRSGVHVGGLGRFVAGSSTMPVHLRSRGGDEFGRVITERAAPR